jgi:hypothetical protein
MRIRSGVDSGTSPSRLYHGREAYDAQTRIVRLPFDTMIQNSLSYMLFQQPVVGSLKTAFR